MQEKLKISRYNKFLIDLSFCEFKKGNISDYERFLGYSTPQPDIRKLMKYLEELEILKLMDIVYGRKIFKLNIKKLVDFIDELEITNKYYDYFYKHHICNW